MMKFVSKAFRSVFPGKKKTPKKAASKAVTVESPETAAIEEAEAAIQEAIAAAKRLAEAAGVESKPKGPAKSPPAARKPAPAMTEARQKIIQDALAVQRSKSHVFDGLSKEAREKLQVMALKALAPDVLDKMTGERSDTFDKRKAAAWLKSKKRD